AVLAADAELQLRLRLPPGPRAEPHEPADARLIYCLGRAADDDLRLDVAVEEAALDVVAREAERRLGEVVGAEREEVGVPGDSVRHQARPRQLDNWPAR